MLGGGFIGPMGGATIALVAGVSAPLHGFYWGGGRRAENFQRREDSKADIKMDGIQWTPKAEVLMLYWKLVFYDDTHSSLQLGSLFNSIPHLLFYMGIVCKSQR